MKKIDKVEIFKSVKDVPVKELIKKMSAQYREESKLKGKKYVDPRFRFEDLMYIFEINTWHQRCIRLKAATSVGLGYDIIGDDEKPIEKDKQPKDEKYTAFRDLLKKPNKRYRFSRLSIREVIDYLGTGNCFMEIVRNGKSNPAELYHARVKNMRIGYDVGTGKSLTDYNKGKPWTDQCGDYYDGFYQIIDGVVKSEFDEFNIEKRREGKNEMIFYNNYDPRSDYYGLPEWLPAMLPALLDRSAAEFNVRMFENDLMLKWIFFLIGAELGKDAKKTLKDFIENNYTGVKNAGRAAFIPIPDGENVKIEAKNLMGDGPNRDMSYAKLREQVRDEMIAAHGVPPRLVGIMAAGQLGGSGELEGQLKMYKETVAIPLKEDMEEMYNRIPVEMDWPYKIQFREFDITTSKEDRSFWNAIPGLVMAGVIDQPTAQNLINIQEEILKSKKTAVTVPEVGFGTTQLVTEIIKLRKAIAEAEKREA